MPPATLLDSLQAVRRKVRMLAVASGMSVSIAAAVGLLVVIVLADWALGLQRAPRLILMLSAIGSLIYIMWHWLVTPAVSKLDIGDVAGRLEHTFPQFDDRLRSTVNFSRGEIPGSRIMQERVVREAQTMAQEVNLHRVIVRGPVYFSTIGALASVLVLATLMTWGGKSGWLSIAANRLMLGNQQWPKSVEIALDSQIPERIPVGQHIPIKIHLTKGDRASRQAIIYYRYDDGAWTPEIMTRKDGAYTALLDARLEQGHKNAHLEFRVEAGDNEVPSSKVLVVPKLDVARVDAEVTPPPYVKPAIVSSINLTERPAIAGYGSTVALRLSFNKALKDGAAIDIRPVKEGMKLPSFQWFHPTPDSAVAKFQADGSFRFSVKATDIDGFQNAGGEEYELSVKEDQPPTVQIEEPKRSEDRTPNAGFDVKAVAEDDYGILGARMVVDRVSGMGVKSTDPAARPDLAAAPQHWVIELVRDASLVNETGSWELGDSSADHRRYHLGYHWELASLANANLKPGDVLEYAMQVKDNFSLNGKEHDWVQSGKLRITIISLEQFMANQQAKAELVHGQIKAEWMGQQRQKAETDTLKQGLDRHQKFDEADKAQANRLANDQASTQSQTMQLADRLSQMSKEMAENKAPENGLKATVDQVEKELRNAADHPMRDAKQNIDTAKDSPQNPKADAKEQSKDSGQRSASLDKASQNQQEAVNQLEKSMNKLGEMDGLPDAIRAMEKARDDQASLENKFQKENKDNIGKRPDELSKEDQERNKKLAEEQKQQAKSLEQALEKMNSAGEKMSKSDPSASQAMKQAAQMGKTQGIPPKQQQAAQNMQENQQAQAQQNQHQVEAGIDQIINKLREAERKRLEELARQLAQMQQLINGLIERQSGHNIDNLLIQGGIKRLEQVESKEREELFAMSGRDPKNMPPAPRLEQLSPSQEQTHSNTVDVAKQAEALPDPVPSAKLTQAAGQMERAIVHLRNAKLPEAYQPPQVDALAALLEAKKAVDEAAKKVQDQIKSDNEETIKQAYVQLLKEQKKVGEDLRKVDATPKENGDLPREQAVRLGQLPTDQGKLIETAGKIGEKLKKLDSVVYDYAHKDIVKSMGAVKDGLAKPETGKPTQVAEAHTEEQLQAMIDSLVQKKREKQFDDRNKGGGSGNGSPKAKLPTEAELRLLKKNQEQFVNAPTKDVDAAKEKDKGEMLDLSTRQGDIRHLLDQLIQKATQGQQKLGPAPDPKDRLPEEASKEQIDNQELEDNLLRDKEGDKKVDTGEKLVGDRMSRSADRLANNDPGKVTQEIQRRIVIDIDALIEMAQQQQSQSKPSPGQGKPGEKMGQPKPGDQPQQANKNPGQQKGGTTAAADSTLTKGGSPEANLDANVKEAQAEWGRVTNRDRQAVQEGASDEVVKKYQRLVEDYYRSLAEQASAKK